MPPRNQTSLPVPRPSASRYRGPTCRGLSAFPACPDARRAGRGGREEGCNNDRYSYLRNSLVLSKVRIFFLFVLFLGTHIKKRVQSVRESPHIEEESHSKFRLRLNSSWFRNSRSHHALHLVISILRCSCCYYVLVRNSYYAWLESCCYAFRMPKRVIGNTNT